MNARLVFGAVAKSKCSAQTLRRDVKRTGTYILAGGLFFKPVYIAFQDNFADAQSRGIVSRWRSRWTRAQQLIKHAIDAAKTKHIKQGEIGLHHI